MNQESEIQSKAMDKLVKDLGIDTLPEDKQNQLLIKMTEALLKRIFIESMDKIGQEGRDEYEKLLERKASSEEIENFFKEKINNHDELIQKVIEEFRDEILSGEVKKANIV